MHHKKPWRAVLARRRWRKGFNAGGSYSFKDTFALNPQFHIQIPKSGANKVQVVVSVTQLYSNSNISNNLNSSNNNNCCSPNGSLHHQHYHTQIELKSIGFCVFEVPPGVNKLTHSFIMNNRPLDATTFTQSRETVTFFTLPPGNFIIVPSTEKPNQETKFILRILTDELSNIWEINDDNFIYQDLKIPNFIDSFNQVKII